MKKLTIISGSTRNDSMNKKLAKLVAQLPLEEVKSTYVDLKEYPVPLYDGDLEEQEGFPENATKLRNMIKESDALVIVTPEYNGSYSAVLKNIIDWMSRPQEGEEVYAAYVDKPVLVMAASPTEYGGARAIGELKTLASNISMKPYEKHIALAHSYQAFDEEGMLKDEEKYKEVVSLVKEFIAQ